MSVILKAQNLQKCFGSNKVFSGLNITLEKNKITALYGQSGIGKTTLLRCLALLEQPEKGDLEIGGAKTILDGEIIDEKTIRNEVGIVFQDFHLWDNKKAIDNITEALVFVKQNSREKARSTAEEIAARLQLPMELLEKYPPELSRGQRQRVAIARALVTDPNIILMDEPTASLDQNLVEEVVKMIRMLRDSGKTILIVSHDQDLVKRVGDQVYDFHELINAKKRE